MEKLNTTSPADHLQMRLFAPGMSLLHRAGVGGLACTLKALERQYEGGLLQESKLPAPINGDSLPWKIEDDLVTLRFGKPENATEYLKRLFAFAFQIKDGLIFLPGQYPDPPPSLSVRAELQTALSRTFLQGAKKNLGVDAAIPYFADPDGTGSAPLTIEFQRCNWYVHQRAWEALVDPSTSTLLQVPRPMNVGSFNPGAIKRHDALKESAIIETPEGLLCSIFFLVGCFALRLGNSGDGVLVIPDVQNLTEFIWDRPFLTPRTVSEARVGGAADAAYQAEVRLRSRCLLLNSSLPSCRAVRFSLRTWTRPQKSRVAAIDVSAGQMHRIEPLTLDTPDRSLRRFEVAMAVLPRGVRSRNDQSTYWADSVIRPLIADNLASGRRWYAGFVTLMTKATLGTERKGLRAMISDHNMWDNEGEQLVVRAVDEALRRQFRTIDQIYEDRPTLIGQKCEDERDRWGRAFSGAMTAAQFRKVLCDLFRRAGPNQELQRHWELLLPMLRPDNWQHARDLALIGLLLAPWRGGFTKDRSKAT